MKVKPLQDRVLIKRVEEEAKTKGGIIIPDTAKEKPQEGLVVAVGPGKIASLSRTVLPGSREWDVLYRQYAEEERRKLKPGGA